MQITFIRHGETVGNLTHVWQGQGDSPLTERGRRQARDLGSRRSMSEFDLVLSSDLGRVRETAALAGLHPEPDPVWREIHLGKWEGMTSAQIAEKYPDEVEALRSGGDVPLGGGESTLDLGRRVDGAIAATLERIDPGDRVAVVAHGGIIQSIIAGHLDWRKQPRPWPIDRLRNTSMTTFEYADGGQILRVFNDATHTETFAHEEETGSSVALVRHGETFANVDGRWQGITDGPLTPRGHEQAAELAAAYDGLAHVYSSDLQRAKDTAAALAESSGVGMTIRPRLHELHFGEWEDLTPDQMVAGWREEFEAIYVHNEDHPRGVTGETAADMGRRIAAEVAEIAAVHPEGRVAAVSHGGAIRAYACDLVGLPFDNREHLAIGGNTEVSLVRFGEKGPVLSSYNTRPGR